MTGGKKTRAVMGSLTKTWPCMITSKREHYLYRFRRKWHRKIFHNVHSGVTTRSIFFCMLNFWNFAHNRTCTDSSSISSSLSFASLACYVSSKLERDLDNFVTRVLSKLLFNHIDENSLATTWMDTY